MLVGAAEGVIVGSGRLGGDVIVLCSCVVVVSAVLVAVVVSSLQPQNRPGVMHVVLVSVGVVEVVVVVTLVVVSIGLAVPQTATGGALCTATAGAMAARAAQGRASPVACRSADGLAFCTRHAQLLHG